MNSKLSVTIAKVGLETMCFPGNATKLIVDTAIILHAIKTGTYDMYDISRFHCLINW